MEIVGLIVVSCVLMCFNGGIVGVIMLWGWVLWEASKAQKNKERYNKAKDDFKRTHGYDYPGYWK